METRLKDTVLAKYMVHTEDGEPISVEIYGVLPEQIDLWDGIKGQGFVGYEAWVENPPHSRWPICLNEGKSMFDEWPTYQQVWELWEEEIDDPDSPS